MRPTVSGARRRVGAGGGGGGGGGSPFFSDNLEGGQFNNANGFTWSPQSAWSVSSDYAFDGGTHSAKCVIGPNASDASGGQASLEILFSLGRGLSEIWVEWKWLVPSNYFHRDRAGFSDNNKFFNLWTDSDTAGTPKLALEYNPRVVSSVFTGDSLTRPTIRYSTTGVLNQIENGKQWIGGTGPIVRGQVCTNRVHYRRESFYQASDGFVQWWANGTPMITASAGPWGAVEANLWNDPITQGYFFGPHNAGFDEATTFYMGAFKFYDTNPVWD